MTRYIKHTLALLLALLAAPLSAQETAPAQQPVFGVISYNAVFQQMPDYAEAQQKFQQLKAQYDAEAERSDAEFQRKFSEFLQGQKEFPRSIMQKRQTELQDLMDKGIAFRQQAQQLLADAQAELQRPVEKRLDAAIAAVAAQRGLLFVLNTDIKAAPFTNPLASIDVTSLVLQQLGIAAPAAAAKDNLSPAAVPADSPAGGAQP